MVEPENNEQDSGAKPKVDEHDTQAKPERVICSICNISLSSKRVLKRHIATKHVPRVETNKRPDKPYKCNQCTRQFGQMKNLTYHKKKDHNIMPDSRQRLKPCPLCQFVCESRERAEMDRHLNCVHNVDITPKEISFDTFQAFINWKETFEKNTKTKYIVTGKSKDGTIKYYSCHRSGFYLTKGKGMRKIKSQGSKKINSYCPSYMRALNGKDGVILKYLDSHVGHENELVHISLTHKEREAVASMISSNIPFDNILKEAKDPSSEVDRLSLLKKKDLYNIGKDFKLKYQSFLSRKTKESCLDTWVREVLASKHNCILYYKQETITDSQYPSLLSGDFMLALMTNYQLEMLKRFGHNSVCLDRSLGVNIQNYLIITLMVVDDSRLAYPCSFLITNRLDQDIAIIYFELIKKEVGILSPSIFMSDPEDILYSAWCTAMAPPIYRFFSKWHVEYKWSESLAMIQSEMKRNSTHKTLVNLMEEKDIKAFEATFTVVTDLLACDDDTRAFSTYIIDNFKNTVKNWATCHRIRCGLDSTIHMERIHQTLQHMFIKSKLKLDSCVLSILKLVKDKFYDRHGLIKNSSKKSTGIITGIKSRHKQAENMMTACVTKKEFLNAWEVSSASRSENGSAECYTVYKVMESCPCHLICPDCNVCIHLYVCKCEDSYLKWNMCRHIHLVCSCESLTTSAVLASYDVGPPSIKKDDIDTGSDIYVNCSTENDSTNIMIEVIDNNQERWSIKRDKLIHDLEGLIEQAKTCSEVEVCAMEDMIAQVIMAMSNMKCQQDQTAVYQEDDNNCSTSFVSSQCLQQHMDIPDSSEAIVDCCKSESFKSDLPLLN